MKGLTDYSIRRLALVLAVQAEIEAAKTDNKQQELSGAGVNVGWNYPPQWFESKAQELRDLGYAHDEQLFG